MRRDQPSDAQNVCTAYPLGSGDRQPQSWNERSNFRHPRVNRCPNRRPALGSVHGDRLISYDLTMKRVCDIDLSAYRFTDEVQIEIVKFFKSSRERYGHLLRSMKNTLVSGTSGQYKNPYSRDDIEFCNIPLQCVRASDQNKIGDISLMLYTTETKFAIVKMKDPSNTNGAHADDIILLEWENMNNFDFFGVPFPVNSEQYRLLSMGSRKNRVFWQFDCGQYSNVFICGLA